MNKTKFVSVDDTQKEKKETVFTHEFVPDMGWSETKIKTTNYNQVVYLGKCNIDGDMFACYISGDISIFKGTKGDEFNNQ